MKRPKKREKGVPVRRIDPAENETIKFLPIYGSVPADVPTAPVAPELPGQVDPALADEFSAWVNQHVARICPEGCLPTSVQQREIDLFARVTWALIRVKL
jgi:hypothetical protein